jgi:predicted lipid-binding transport protein (Tim44 family)
MNSSHSRDVITTLTSLWSAMLGGAMGAATGGSMGPMGCSVVIGFGAGFVFSVLMFLPLAGLVQAISLFVIDSEFEGEPIGCASSDRLSALLGATAGAIGAAVVSALPNSYSLLDPRPFVICWTVVAFVPIIVSFALVAYARWKNDS